MESGLVRAGERAGLGPDLVVEPLAGVGVVVDGATLDTAQHWTARACLAMLAAYLRSRTRSLSASVWCRCGPNLAWPVLANPGFTLDGWCDQVYT